MKKQEFIWEPISEWGMSMKPYLDQVKRQAVIVMRNPKPQVVRPRVRVYSPKPSTKGDCPGCGVQLGPQNKSGICNKCCTSNTRKQMKMGPRPTCNECGINIPRNNTKGLCKLHKKRRFSYQFCACGKQLSNRNISGVCKACQLAAAGPRELCTVCGICLSHLNKTGLCLKHGKSARQMAYRARKAA